MDVIGNIKFPCFSGGSGLVLEQQPDFRIISFFSVLENVKLPFKYYKILSDRFPIYGDYINSNEIRQRLISNIESKIPFVDEQKCSICSERFCQTDDYIWSPNNDNCECIHWFCTDCLRNIDEECPICEIDISQSLYLININDDDRDVNHN